MVENGIIKEILHVENKGEYALVYVLLGDGLEVEIYVGGSVKYWHDPIHNKIKGHVKYQRD